jgi:hypothetical protein
MAEKDEKKPRKGMLYSLLVPFVHYFVILVRFLAFSTLSIFFPGLESAAAMKIIIPTMLKTVRIIIIRAISSGVKRSSRMGMGMTRFTSAMMIPPSVSVRVDCCCWITQITHLKFNIS